MNYSVAGATSTYVREATFSYRVYAQETYQLGRQLKQKVRTNGRTDGRAICIDLLLRPLLNGRRRGGAFQNQGRIMNFHSCLRIHSGRV